MEQTLLLWILGGMNAVTWLLLGWIKFDQKAENKSLWKRADCHGHTIHCLNGDCRGAETKDVTIKGGN
jgi:hypothetical protein